MKRRVLVTGAAGRVAKILMDATRDAFEFVCVDRRPAAHVPGLIVADLTDLAALERAAAGCDAMVHLGAHPNHHPDYPGVIVPSNLVGLHNAFEAAARAGVRRVVFASTVQVEWGWPEGTKVSVEMPGRPSNYYSASKLFGEHLGWLYHRDRGLSVICLRLGGVIIPEHEQQMLERGDIPEDIALFAGDAAEILRRAIEAPDVPYAVVPAYSRNAAAIKDLEPLKRILGYEPRDDAAARLAAAKARPREERPHAALFAAAKAGDLAALGAALDADSALLTGGDDLVRHLFREAGTTEAARFIAGRAGASGFHLACVLGDAAEVSRLLDGDPGLADALSGRSPVFPPGRKPLHLAVHRNRAEVVRILLTRGADPNAPDMDGATALHAAAWRGNLDMIRALVNAGARLGATDAEYSATPRDWAEYAKQPAAAALLKALVDSPAAKAAAAAALPPPGAPVVHRSACGPDADFPTLVERDILGLWRALEGARAAHAASFTFEATADPWGGWPGGTRVDPETTPRRPATLQAAVDSMNEVIVATYGKRMGLPVAVRRPVTTAG